MTQLSIVIPVYNSAENIEELCFQIDDALKEYDYELILVDDKSTDNSWTEISRMAEIHSTVNGIHLRKNYGQDNALMAGLHEARGEYVVIMDDDLQHSPYDIDKLYIACSTKQADVCYADFVHLEHVWWKRLGSWLNGKVAEWLLNKKSEIYLSPFKIMRKDIVDEIVKYSGPYPYIDGLILWTTDNLIQIPLEHNKRHKGKSNFNFLKSLSVFSRNLTTFSVVPLRIASILGFLFAFSGFFLIIYYIYDYFTTNRLVEGWTTIVLLQLTIGGINLMSLGLKGEYLGRTYMNVNNKPQFIVKKTTIK